MAKYFTVADKHSEHNPKNRARIELQGGSPWFAYIWLDDELYVISKGERSFSLTRERWVGFRAAQ